LNIDETLDRAEGNLAHGRGLRGTGFWRAVEAVRRDRALADRYADRIGSIDLRAFERGVRMRVPATLGLAALALGLVFGVFALVLSVRWALRGLIPAAFLIGFGAVLICSHSLTHWLVGRLVGIRFTHLFLGGPPPPRPGVKTDYATYLRVSPMKRAVMHASGAVVSKIVPFALLGVSLQLYDDWPWLTWILLIVGVVQIFTDALLSTKSSDWMKVRRELRAARSS
jgi:hypothetical protein